MGSLALEMNANEEMPIVNEEVVNGCHCYYHKKKYRGKKYRKNRGYGGGKNYAQAGADATALGKNTFSNTYTKANTVAGKFSDSSSFSNAGSSGGFFDYGFGR